MQLNTLAQSIVTGRITTSEDNSGLPGATVLLKGTTQGTATDADGNYRIEVPDDAVLVISSVGFGRVEVVVEGRNTINIALAPEIQSLSEVIVVGYGTQEKANLTGAVAKVDAATLMERPATNSANLLQGRVTGLEVIQPTGQPGADNPVFRIRGLGSFGASSAPLVLIDGIQGDITSLAPNDIESVTVLKDAASAAIYGSRAANGVILVTTKAAKEGRITIEYQLDIGLHNATMLPELVTNSADYMEMFNAGRERNGLPLVYTQDQIDAYRNATDRIQYPNFDAMDYFFNQATVINHHLGISGGNEKTSYKLSVGLLDQEGVLVKHDFQRYNTLFSLNSKVNDAIKIGTITRLTYRDVNAPVSENDGVVLGITAWAPTFMPYLPDGSGRRSTLAYPSELGNPVAANALFNGGVNRKEYTLNSQAFIDINIIEGLTWKTKVGVNYNSGMSKKHQYTTPSWFYQKNPGDEDYPIHLAQGAGRTGVQDDYNIGVQPFIFSTLNYEKLIARDHRINLLGGFEQQSFKYNYVSGNRQVFPTDDLKELNAGAADGQIASGSAYEWALRSYFGRANYDYKGRYLLEANIRYDGTSRVYQDNRWGLFPSASVGWRLSGENFMEGVSWLDDLKLRASFGTLGNQEISNYPYQDILSLTNYPFANSVDQGVLLTRLTDKNLQWETTKMLDIGMDFTIDQGLINLTVDWFKRNTTNILTTQPVPQSIGLAGPVTNDGELLNTGWEVALNHQHKIGEFRYSLNLMGSTFKNELLSIVTPTKGVREVGLPYDSHYVYEWIGIFQSQADIDNSPEHIYYTPRPGDLKIKDQNGDNVVDEKDRISISPFPDFTYSFGAQAGWKGFNLSVFFQGVQGQNMKIDAWGYDPFVQGGAPPVRFYDAWTPENPSNTVPAMHATLSEIRAYYSTYYIHDVSYLRLKNVNLSYTLPKALTDKIKSQGITVYVSGDNLLTKTNYAVGDPERLQGNARGAQFPQVRIVNMGMKVKF